jgi:hypothetical protein
MESVYQNVRALYLDAIMYNQMYLCCIIPILLQHEKITYEDSIEEFLSQLDITENKKLIERHPTFQDYLIKDRKALKEFFHKHPSSSKAY